MRLQEVDKSSEIPQSWQARVAALPPSSSPIWTLQVTARLPLGSQDLNLMIPKLNYPEGSPNSEGGDVKYTGQRATGTITLSLLLADLHGYQQRGEIPTKSLQ